MAAAEPQNTAFCRCPSGSCAHCRDHHGVVAGEHVGQNDGTRSAAHQAPVKSTDPKASPCLLAANSRSGTVVRCFGCVAAFCKMPIYLWHSGENANSRLLTSLALTAHIGQKATLPLRWALFLGIGELTKLLCIPDETGTGRISARMVVVITICQSVARRGCPIIFLESPPRVTSSSSSVVMSSTHGYWFQP